MGNNSIHITLTSGMVYHLSLFSSEVQGALDTARIEADKIMRSDGPLLFPPGQVIFYNLHPLLK